MDNYSNYLDNVLGLGNASSMFRVLPFIVTVFFLRMYQFIVAIVSSPRVIVVTESPKVKGVVILGVHMWR